MIKTQLGGKFSKEDDGLFILRKKLISSDISVEFPFNDGIIGEHNGISVTFIPTKERSFYDVEIEFFNAISNNPVHIVHNKNGDNLGYIGVSASIEIAYAIIRNKPIVLLFEPNFSDKVPSIVKDLIVNNLKHFFILRLDTMSSKEIQLNINKIIEVPICYEVEVKRIKKLTKVIDDLLNSYILK